VGVGERGTCTLLGPEGPGGSTCILWTSSGHALLGCGWWGYRPYFENYTVDASIFETISIVSF